MGNCTFSKSLKEGGQTTALADAAVTDLISPIG
jgi:hypothetical protein